MNIHTEMSTMKAHARQTFCFLLSVLFLQVAADRHAPEVQTKLGSLKGKYISVKGKETGVHAYLGIPFAKPPIGPALRLSAPQPVEGWEGVRDATKQPPMCVQSERFVFSLLESLSMELVDTPETSEDCLYLNIYTPANRAHNAKLPVMVWIHGGGFALGSASLYDGSAMAAYQDVVVVLIQYRLGILGFVSTGDEHLSGNFGLLDQVQALRWIQEHIHNFGGDPNLVTIFGESAGGMSVSLLLLSPLSNGLFHNAIAESGTAAMELIIVNDPLPSMQIVANLSGCSLESTEEMADCMKNLDINTIMTVVQDHVLSYTINIDGHFLTKSVDELYDKHELPTIPFMTGINNHEGGWMLCGYFGPPNWTEGIDQEHMFNVISLFYPGPKDALLRDLIVEEYTGSGEDPVKNRDGFTELIGDALFFIPAIKTAIAHRDAGAPVYLYEYQHPPQFLQAKRPSFVRSDHGDEIFTVLGFCFTNSQIKMLNNVTCTEEEEQLSKIMMSYWGNFARTGSPNGDGVVHWPKYGVEEEYLQIGLKEQIPGHHLKKDKAVFWTQTLPEKRQQQKEKMHSEL